MEDELNKTTKMEDDIKQKMEEHLEKMEDDLKKNGRRPPKKMEDDLKKMKKCTPIIF